MFCFLVDGVFKTTFGVIGFFVNCIAIKILVSQKKMQKMFHHLLTCSLIIDNCYIFVSSMSTIYYFFNVEWIIWAFPYFVIPFEQISYVANVLITVCLSHERYAILSDPRAYNTNMAGAAARYYRLGRYMIFVVIFSIAVNVPRFLTYV